MVVAQATGDAGSVGVLTASIVLGAFILKLVDLIKYVTAGQARSAFTLLLMWAVGFAAVQFFIETQWGDEVTVGNETLDQLSTWSKVVFGLAAPSLAALLYDAKKAVDDTDSAKTPRLGERNPG